MPLASQYYTQDIMCCCNRGFKWRPWFCVLVWGAPRIVGVGFGPGWLVVGGGRSGSRLYCQGLREIEGHTRPSLEDLDARVGFWGWRAVFRKSAAPNTPPNTTARNHSPHRKTHKTRQKPTFISFWWQKLIVWTKMTSNGIGGNSFVGYTHFTRPKSPLRVSGRATALGIS